MSPIFILPFDHRSTFAKKLLGFNYPTDEYQAKVVTEMKEIVFDAFLKVYNERDDIKDNLAILVDLEFGEKIIEIAKKKGIAFAISTEKSGQQIFTFEYGDDFEKKLSEFIPTYAKALVRYNPDDHDGNEIQLERLKRLSDFCKEHQIGFMFELLVKGEAEQLELMIRSIKQIVAYGIEPTLWKLEGLDDGKGWSEIAKLTKDAKIIVLGRGESKKAVEKWIREAATSGHVHGFAIGRTIFLKSLEKYRDGKIKREKAVEKIAKNYLHFINLWMDTVR